MKLRVALRPVLLGCIVLGIASISGAQAPPAPEVNSVLNAASYSSGSSATGQISPGTIVSIFGTNMTDGREMSASSVPLPRSLAGATVLIGGIASPLFFVSPIQINAQVPMEVVGQGSVQVRVRVETSGGTVTSTARSEAVGPVTPGIFTLDQNGRGPGVMQRGSDYSLLCPGGRADCSFNPAEPSEALVVYATGLGPVNGNLVTGESPGEAAQTTNIPTATIGGVPATVLYSGVTVGSVGLYQVNIRVPNQIPIGEDPELLLTFRVTRNNQMFTIRSNTVTIPSQYMIPGGGGPAGGKVNTIAVDPRDPSIVYLGTDSGVYRSTDGGERWTQRTSGLTSPRVSKILIDPTNPATLYAGTATGGVFKSTDGGETWAPRNMGITVLQIQTLAADPTNPAIIYAMTQLRTFKTVTGGESWTPLPGSPGATLLAVDPLNPNILYANRGGLAKSVDGGVTWSPSNTGFARRDQEVITAIAIDPSSPSTVYVATFSGIYKSTDAAGSWSRPAGSQPSHFTDLKIIPGQPQTLIGVSFGVYRSNDGGASWSSSNESVTTGIDQLGLDPQNPDTVYLGNVGGMHKSTDRGASWRRINTGLTASNIAALAADRSNPATVYAADELVLHRTSDGGSNWTRLEFRQELYIYPSHLTVDPRNPTTIFAAGVNGVFKTTDGGVNWTDQNSPFGYATIVIDPANSNVLYAQATQIYKSVDGGSTWTNKTSDLGIFEFQSVAIDPTDSRIVYGGTRSHGIYKSIDGGETWTASSAGLPPFGALFQRVTSIVVEAANPSRLYAGTSVGVYRSVDGGISWTASNVGMPDLSVSALVMDPSNSAVLYVVAGGAGIYKSVNGAESWVAHNNGLSYQSVRALLVDPNDSSRVYAGTERGVFRSTDGGQSWVPTNAN